jgi:hypothetical protein
MMVQECAGFQNFRVETVYLDETTLLVKLIFHLASFSNLHHLPFTLSGQKLLHSRSCRVPPTQQIWVFLSFKTFIPFHNLSK